MDKVAQINRLLDFAGEIGVEVRHASLGGEGGGLCIIRGKRVLFVDTAAAVTCRLERTAQAIATLPETETRFLRPDIRELLAAHR